MRGQYVRRVSFRRASKTPVSLVLDINVYVFSFTKKFF
jgi:hypothetical protein